MTFDEEAAVLAPFLEEAEKGEMLGTVEIEKGCEEKVGHRIGSGQIFRVLHRHGWRKVMPRSRHPKKASEEVIATSKKDEIGRLKLSIARNVHLMFQDEAGFGRINKPKYCWCSGGKRPSVPCHHNREYRYAYGSVEPSTRDSFFLIMPYCNAGCMNVYLQALSKEYPDDIILLCCDGTAWYKAGSLQVPKKRLCHIPPYTPEMNPIEQIWKELRQIGFRNEVFASLEKVVDRALPGNQFAHDGENTKHYIPRLDSSRCYLKISIGNGEEESIAIQHISSFVL